MYVDCDYSRESQATWYKFIKTEIRTLSNVVLFKT